MELDKIIETVTGRGESKDVQAMHSDIIVGMHDRLNDHEDKIHHLAEVGENHANHLEELHEKADHLAEVGENHAGHLENLTGE